MTISEVELAVMKNDTEGMFSQIHGRKSGDDWSFTAYPRNPNAFGGLTDVSVVVNAGSSPEHVIEEIQSVLDLLR